MPLCIMYLPSIVGPHSTVQSESYYARIRFGSLETGCQILRITYTPEHTLYRIKFDVKLVSRRVKVFDRICMTWSCLDPSAADLSRRRQKMVTRRISAKN